MIETVEADDDTRQKRPTAKKRSMDVLESTVNFLLICFMKNSFGIFLFKTSEQQKRGRLSGYTTTTTTGTSDFYSVGSESESSYQTAGENEDFKPKFLKKLNDTLATGYLKRKIYIFI